MDKNIIKDLAKEIIEKDLDLKVVKIQEIKEGFSHNKFIAETSGDPKEVIIRFENQSIEDKEKGLGREQFVTEKLRENNIPAPKTYVFNNKNENMKEHYVIIEKLPGKILEEIWSSISKEEKVQVTEEIGKLLSKIHEIKFNKYGNLLANGKIQSDVREFKFKNMGETREFSPYLRHLLTEFNKDVARLMSYKEILPQLPGKTILYIMKNIEHLEYEKEPTLLHGDFHRDHIFVEKENNNWKIVGIIDFEFASSLAPEYDMLKLDRQGFFEDKELRKSFEKGYGKEFSMKSVLLSRLMRDFGLGTVLIDSGSIDEGMKILKSVEERIDKDFISQT